MYVTTVVFSSLAMYSEWVSPTEAIQTDPPPENVLQTFPVPVGKDVVQSVLRPLSQLSTSRSSEVSSLLHTPEQVQWTMQVIGFGLTLPLTEQLVTLEGLWMVSVRIIDFNFSSNFTGPDLQ